MMKSIEAIPAEMRAIQLGRYHPDLQEAIRSLTIVTKNTPELKSAQVLVRIEAAPVNPSDTLYLRGRYGVRKTLPAVPGWEGAGRVVAVSGGLYGRWLLGKRVACAGQGDRDGTWAEYYLADERACLPLSDKISVEQGATMLVNPLTALAFIERVEREGHRAAVQTGAGGQLGRMMVSLAARRNITLINVVRKDEDVQALKSAGADAVLNSSVPSFDADLQSACQKLHATIAFDAVAGSMTGRLVTAMPERSTVVVYGALSDQPCAGINPIDLIFHDKRVDGFWLTTWLTGRGRLRLLRVMSRVRTLAAEGSLDRKPRFLRVRLDEVPDHLYDRLKDKSGAKVVIDPRPS